MLRESSLAFGYDIDIRAISNDTFDSGVPGGDVLLPFVDVVMTGTASNMQAARDAIVDRLGEESLVDAAGTYGNFQMMNRVAEGTGIPTPGAAIEREATMVDALGLNDFYKH